MEGEGTPSDDEGVAAERELEALEHDDAGFGDEEPEVDEDSDEVAADVAASDAAAIEGIIEEADLDGRLSALSAEDSKIAKLSIAKVRPMSLARYILMSISSYALWRRKLSTVQRSRRTLSLAVRRQGSSLSS